MLKSLNRVNTKRNITFLHPDWQIGGVERTNTQWIKGLQTLGYTCDVVTSGYQDFEIETKGEVQRYKNKISLYLFFIVSSFKSKAIVVTQAYYLPWIYIQLFLLKIIFGTKIIIAERNSFIQYRTSMIKSYIMRFLFSTLSFIIDNLVLNSEELSQEYPYVKLKHKAIVIKNPRFDSSDLSLLYERKNNFDADQVAYFGRWVYQKNTEFISKSVEVFRTNDMVFKAFCGEKTHAYQENFVESVIQDLVKQPRPIFFCSHFEGYPNILIEARSLGVPIIYSECPTGVREILDGYENGFRFKKDDIQDLDKVIKEYRVNAKLIPIDFNFAEEHSVNNKLLCDKLSTMAS